MDAPSPTVVEAFLAGDRNAAKDIEAHVRKAFQHWKGRFDHETDDILSDIWYKLLVSFRREALQDHARLASFIGRIVNHTCIDYLRFRKRVVAVDIDTVEIEDRRAGPEEDLIRQQEAAMVFRVLRLVPKECRRMWRMQLKQGLTCRQIGEILEKSEGNIRRKLWACRKNAVSIRARILKKGKPFPPPSAGEYGRGGSQS